MKSLKLGPDGKYGLNALLVRVWILKYLGIKVVNIKIHHTIGAVGMDGSNRGM